MVDGGNGIYKVDGDIQGVNAEGRILINFDGRTEQVYGNVPDGRGQGKVTLNRQGDSLTLLNFHPQEQAHPVELQPTVRRHGNYVYAVESNNRLIEVDRGAGLR
jgi:hypothetical protein